jgi:hypothetical protein
VIAREAVLNHADVVKLLKDHFVCIAIDNVENQNMTAAEKQWLSDKGGRACTQGMSVFTAGGKVLAQGGGYQPEPVVRMLKNALSKYEPEPEPKLPAPTDEEMKGMIRRPPEGGLVFYVTWKVLRLERPESSPTTGCGRYDEAFLRTLGVDRLWARKDEAQAAARSELPESLQTRMLRHIAYALGGKVRKADLTLRDGCLSGSVLLDHGGRAEVLGFIETKDGKLTRFDVVVKGMGKRVNDFGFSAGLSVVPEGQRVPVALAFTLADPKDDLARVPPHQAGSPAYLR